MAENVNLETALTPLSSTLLLKVNGSPSKCQSDFRHNPSHNPSHKLSTQFNRSPQAGITRMAKGNKIRRCRYTAGTLHQRCQNTRLHCNI